MKPVQRRVLVTGGSRGIGLEIAGLLREREYNVVCPSRQELDLANPTSVDTFFRNQNGFDILVNNAGINHLASLDEITEAQWAEMLEVNLTSPRRLIQKVAPHMRQNKWGRIVNVSSIFSLLTKERRGAYSAAKSGLNGLTRTVAVELGPSGILVNAICPGYIETQMTFKNNSPAEIEKITGAIPLRRMAQAREIAEMVEFLVSERNTYLTGQMLIVDGGFSIQ